MSMTVDDKMRQREASMKGGLQEFMHLPQTRFMISLIPTGDNKDALVVLLQSAYETGFARGGAEVASDFIQAMMKATKDK